MVDPATSPRRTRSIEIAASRRRQRGVSSVLWIIIITFVLLGFISFAVDVGRMRTSKAQLSTAADAASMAGAGALTSGDLDVAEGAAVDVALQNVCAAAPVTLLPADDLEFGLFRVATSTYTPVGEEEPGGHVVLPRECNAAKATPRRLAARGNPVPLTFRRFVSPSNPNVDLTATATSFVRGGRRAGGLVGLDWVRFNGTASTDSYDQEPYDQATRRFNGTVMSNGTIYMNGTTDIWGDARPGMEASVDMVGGAQVHGWMAPLDEPLSFDPAVVPAGLTNSGPLNLSGNTSYTLPPGSYWFSSVNMSGNAALIVQPNVKLYVTGNLDISGGSVTNSGPASGFEIFKVGGGTVRLGGGSVLKAHVYAPEANVIVHGTGQGSGQFDLHGWVIGRTITLNGRSAIHYDETLGHLDQPHRTVLIR